MGSRGSDAKRRKIRKQLEQYETTCWLCGFPLDPTAPANTDMSTEMDEIVPKSRGGSTTDINNIHLTHRICNNKWKSNQILKQGSLHDKMLDFLNSQREAAAEPSRNWL